VIAKSRADYRAYRISPGDTNRLVLVFDPAGDQANFVFAIEIFDVGGRTPPNVHRRAHEMFYVLAGEGIAHAGGRSVAFGRGDSLLLPPGTTHQIENTGPARLYCMTVMVPDEDFAALIRGGEPVALDEEDWSVLHGTASPSA
jgi:mannose-6-phosphate isomerase-like protein (cupin superfamily)